MIKRALLSVSDKTGLVEFARGLAEFQVELISTGGTAKALREAGLSVKDLSDFTGFPEMLDGRVKTLHPKVHAGLLYIRGKLEHEAAVEAHHIQAIDLVVVNLYPFEQTISKPNVDLHEAIENIDIGGPSMLRSAAKNHENVTVVVDAADYPRVLDEMHANKGATTLELRRLLAAKVYLTTSRYDAAIGTYLSQKFTQELPQVFAMGKSRAQSLRYGENPHQRAALYGNFGEYFEQLHGKELSYNNILDLAAASSLIAEFLSPDDPPTLAILKHTNPCGLGTGATLKEAWEKAFATDNQAPFGGIIAVNRPLDLQCAEAIAEIFSEVIVAPGFWPDALERLQKKKNLRLMKLKRDPREARSLEVRSALDSILVQERDLKQITRDDLKVVTHRKPTEQELTAMVFGWRIVRHVKSNAIIYVAQDRTLGIGAGQMSRVDSSRIAIWKAKETGLNLQGSVMVSDALIPFPDGLIAAAEAGASAVIQTGGSLRDEEVIKAANERNVAMVFTGFRHFKH